MIKPLLIGEAPSKNYDPTFTPLGGRIGKRLAWLSGLTYEEYLDFFERVNLLKVRQDTKEKGFQFNADAAAEEALRMQNHGPHALGCEERIVLLLGHRVAKAFGCGFGEYFRRWFIGHATSYVLPHPSGVNRWWNDEANVRKAADFMQYIVHHANKGTIEELT